jgi:hypothetical protein
MLFIRGHIAVALIETRAHCNHETEVESHFDHANIVLR